MLSAIASPISAARPCRRADRRPVCLATMRSRLDVEMARRGLAASRQLAQRLIMAGRVRVNSRPVAKADLKVDETAAIDIIGATREYASRGAYKLIGALDHFGLAITGRRALDIGASTGGFTDVLLRRGAA